SWHTILKPEMYQEHPTWFAQIGAARIAPSSDRYKVETTNPNVVRYFATQAIGTFDRYPQRFMFSIAPTDSANWSESRAARALYDKDPDGGLSVSRLVLQFYNAVSERVAEERPDRMLGGLIYA